MDTQRYAERRIDEAIASGDLTPTVGVGEPMRDLTGDPDWWVRAFIERERVEEGRKELEAARRDVVAEAVSVDALEAARHMVGRLNLRIARWNERAPAGFAVEPVSEVWLIAQRARMPGSSDPGISTAGR